MISIKDYRIITEKIYEVYRIDYRNYAISFLRRKIGDAVKNLNYKNFNNFTNDVIHNEKLFYNFIYELEVANTEMFRDPSVWRVIRNNIIPELKFDSTIKIWFPVFSSGEDVLSMAILLKEMNLLDKSKIYISSHCKKNYEKFKENTYTIKRKDINSDNYERFNGIAKLSDYYKIINKRIVMNTSLIENITFINDSFLDKTVNGVKLIMFRNKMLYYNNSLKEKALDKLTESIIPNGYLILGIKETFNYNVMNYREFNNEERIYKKI